MLFKCCYGFIALFILTILSTVTFINYPEIILIMTETETKKVDIAIIGAGPGGYVAAIRAAQLGKKVALIEKGKLGGICLNYGCIPSKAMIYAAEFFDKLKHSSQMGINVKDISLDFSKTQEWKNNIVSKLVAGINFLCRQHKIEVITGTAFFENHKKIKVTGKDSVVYVEFDKVILATGSKPVEIPSFKFDNDRIIGSGRALYLAAIPKHLVVIGAGYIGLELGTVYAKLGSHVHIVEVAPQVLPLAEKEVGDVVHRKLEKMGVDIYLNAKAEKYENGKVIVASKDKGRIELEAEHVLVAVGRQPNTKNLGLENTGVKTDEKGFIVVDKNLRSTQDNIYAIGDISSGPMLAHKASYQGKLVAEIVAGSGSEYRDSLVPSVIFTDPEIAYVGTMESEAKEKGIAVKVGKFPFKASSRAMTRNDTDGFVKIIADKKTNQVIGVQIVGSEASDLISEAALAIKMKTTVEEMALTIHPHPTLSESMMEAAEAAMGKAIHIMNPK